MSLLVCPHCKKKLEPSDNKSFICESNHSFDLAKEGYLNLLPVNQKKSKDPGDNDIMVLARRLFLEKGFYNPMIEQVKELVSQHTKLSNKSYCVLDAGCGEGYYSRKVFESIESKVFGTDISKYAVKRAAKKYKENFYFVSSVYHLPVADQSIDIILSIFSPIHSVEFNRTLNKEGIVIIVGPARNHMKELAELLYDSFRPHQSKLLEQLGEAFQLVKSDRSNFTIQLSNTEEILDLLKMTPYFYNTSKERLEKLRQHPKLEVTCDFELMLLKKKD